MKIDGNWLVRNDLRAQCYGDDSVQAWATAGLALFSFGVPLAGWLFLRSRQSKFEETRFKRHYSFMFAGFKRNYFYWEAVTLFRRSGVVAVAVIVRDPFNQVQQRARSSSKAALPTTRDTERPPPQVYIATWLMMGALLLQLLLQPYRDKHFNWLETLSLATTFFTQVRSPRRGSTLFSSPLSPHQPARPSRADGLHRVLCEKGLPLRGDHGAARRDQWLLLRHLPRRLHRQAARARRREGVAREAVREGAPVGLHAPRSCRAAAARLAAARRRRR